MLSPNNKVTLNSSKATLLSKVTLLSSSKDMLLRLRVTLSLTIHRAIADSSERGKTNITYIMLTVYYAYLEFATPALL
jgi:hypothetical protein